jgi:hypothetical protein
VVISIRARFQLVVERRVGNIEIRLTRKIQENVLGMVNTLDDLHALNVRKPASSMGRHINMKKNNLHLKLLDDCAKNR